MHLKVLLYTTDFSYSCIELQSNRSDSVYNYCCFIYSRMSCDKLENFPTDILALYESLG